MSERVEPRKGFVVGAEALIIVEGSKGASVLARMLSSHRGRSRRHVIEDLLRNLGGLGISTEYSGVGARMNQASWTFRGWDGSGEEQSSVPTVVAADEGRPEEAARGVKESDGSVCTEEAG